MEKRTILNSKHLEITLRRLASQLKENHQDFTNTVLIGLQPKGIFVLERIKEILEADLNQELTCGQLDITFYRDDFRRREQPLIPSVTNIDFIIEDKKVVLIDDVLYTGRSIRSGLEALLAFGRPKQVELMILVDRQFERHLPIQADYIGKTVNTLTSQVVLVEWKQNEGQDQVYLVNQEDKNG
ncbi:MAG: PyrR protein [Crocinitomix sp. MedPE-SWsnd]|nr:MAG: PyrR protein [Crocinitomix sp. MedPE-SWsnd]